MARIITAGILSGIAMFIWSSIAHVALPLGEIGISEVANEQSLLESMHSTLGNRPGFYIFPAGGNTTEAAAALQYAQKIANGPSGLIVYQPSGAEALSAGQLATEFLGELLASLVAVFLLAQTRLHGFASRVAFVTTAGILAALPTNLSYWNWYAFPVSYTAASMAIQIVGFFVAGVVAAAVLKKGLSS